MDRPHHRLKADIPSYVLNVDIAGPFSTGEDVGTGRRVKYVLIGTVPIPFGVGDKEPSEAEEPEQEDPNPADWEEEDDQPVHQMRRPGGSTTRLRMRWPTL